ncbi:hypothetical protein [Halostagnicola sp. A-GB9-2]|uniref:hypothetical protein n=1 Tax=Halostagnicola sp. A-GB9-2 TaxID=3048066 RepID=UPI0024BFB2F8|nr:hypothetical protein [Halostagnicola sp. A-GB9-2]MDJ1433958.1 hypothetical protein [Halostagnicola sp. A-GB9-2]
MNCPSVLEEISAINDTSAVVRNVRIYRDGERLVRWLNSREGCIGLEDESVGQEGIEAYCED